MSKNVTNKSIELKREHLFKIVKSKDDKHIELNKFISDNPKFDYNIVDKHGVYLIQYAIINNNEKILKLLLQCNITIDFLDEKGHTVLYHSIRFGYNNTLKVLINSDTNIGIPVYSLIDQYGYYSIHYAIMFNNSDAFDILIDKTNVSILDINKNNLLQVSIKYRNFYVYNKLLDQSFKLNYQNKLGETILHLLSKTKENLIISNLLKEPEINLNLQDLKNNATPLFYFCIKNNIDIIKKINYDNCDLNIQDKLGNTVFHHCSQDENLIEILDYLLTNYAHKSDVNRFNIYFEYPLHIVLYNIKKNGLNDKYTKYINLLIKYTDLNFRDKNKKSCLMLLCELNLWKQYKDILIEKKLDILSMDNRNKSVIDYISQNEINEINEFIDIIANSYINLLKHKKEIYKFNKWINRFDDDCLNDINKCKRLIKKEIKDKTIKVSYPKRIKPIFNINLNYKDILFSTFTGSSLDILCGLKYLESKTVNCVYNLNKSTQICDFYEQNIKSLNTYECTIESYFIFWFNPSLQIDDNIKTILKQTNKRWSIIVMILLSQLSNSINRHANILIYDKSINEIERYDPYGLNLSNIFYYDILDIKLDKYFNDIDIKYISPKKYLLELGPQFFDDREKVNISDPDGFCVAWCMLYADLRIKNKQIKRNKITKYIIEIFKDQNIKYKSYIRNYSKHITDIRDSILNKVNININDYYNDEISIKTFDNIIELLKSK